MDLAPWTPFDSAQDLRRAEAPRYEVALKQIQLLDFFFGFDAIAFECGELG